MLVTGIGGLLGRLGQYSEGKARLRAIQIPIGMTQEVSAQGRAWDVTQTLAWVL